MVFKIGKIKFRFRDLYRDLYIVLYIFCFIFAPPLVPNVNLIHLLFLYTCIVLITRYNKRFMEALNSVIVKDYFMGYSFLLIYVGILMFLCLASNRINLLNEVTQIYRFFMVVIELPVCSIYIFLYLKNRKSNFYDFLSYIVKAGLIQSVFTILMIGSSSIKRFIVDFMIKNNGKGGSFLNMSVWEYKRRYNAFSNNLQDAFGWGTGIIVSLALFLALKYKRRYFWVLPLLFLVPLFNSVTGVVFSGMACAILLFQHLIKGDVKALNYIIKIIVLILIIGVILSVANPFVFNWVKGNLFAIKSMGQGQSSSTSFGNLMNESNWRFPDSFFEILFGTGHNVMGDAVGYHHADPGITNNIWLMGVLGTGYLYVFWLWILHKSGWILGKDVKYLFFALWLCLVVFEIKGLSNFYNPGIALTECILFSSLMSSKRSVDLLL